AAPIVMGTCVRTSTNSAGSALARDTASTASAPVVGHRRTASAGSSARAQRLSGRFQSPFARPEKPPPLDDDPLNDPIPAPVPVARAPPPSAADEAGPTRAQKRLSGRFASPFSSGAAGPSSSSDAAAAAAL